MGHGVGATCGRQADAVRIITFDLLIDEVPMVLVCACTSG